MGFTTSCFIRKNTPEIRQRLEEMGYSSNEDEEHLYLIADGIITCAKDKEYSFITSAQFTNNLDCGEDEELFFALAGMRDDTLSNQWQISTISGAMRITEHNDKYSNLFRRATAEEIVEYFKKKRG